MPYDNLKTLEACGGALVIVPSFYREVYERETTMPIYSAETWGDILVAKRVLSRQRDECLKRFNKTIVLGRTDILRSFCDRYVFNGARLYNYSNLFTPGCFFQKDVGYAFSEALNDFQKLGYTIILT